MGNCPLGNCLRWELPRGQSSQVGILWRAIVQGAIALGAVFRGAIAWGVIVQGVLSQNFPPGQLFPVQLPPRRWPPKTIFLRIIPTQDSCPPDYYPPDNYPPSLRTIPTQENCPQIIAPEQFPPRITDHLFFYLESLTVFSNVLSSSSVNKEISKDENVEMDKRLNLYVRKLGLLLMPNPTK